MQRLNRKQWGFLALAVVFCIMLARYSFIAPKRHYSDFRVYYAAAKTFVEGKNIYRFEDASLTPFKYSPFFAFTISPLAFLSIGWASRIFFVLNFGCLALIFLISYRFLVTPGQSPIDRGMLMAVPLLFSLRFFMGILDAGQVNLIMMALVIGAVYSARKRNDFMAGALLAASIMVKYVSFIFVPYFLLRGRIKLAVVTLVWIGIYSIVPAAAVGWAKQGEYLRDWLPSITQNSLDRGSWTDHKNQSMGSFVVRSMIRNSPYKDLWPGCQATDLRGALLVAGLLSAGLYAIILCKEKGLPPDTRDVTPVDLALLFIGMAIFNANAWPFNFAVYLVGSMVVVSEFLRTRGGTGRRVGIFFFILSFVLANIGSESLVGNQAQYRTEVWSFLTMSALVLFGVLATLKFNHSRVEI